MTEMGCLSNQERGDLMGRSGFRIVPRMIDQCRCQFDIVLLNGEFRTIGEVHFPNDGQQNDNLEAAQIIADAIKKRIRKSVG